MADKYYVFFAARPAEGLQAVYGPYGLKSAKDHARISSAHGGDAEVWRGRYRRRGSKRVRVYRRGRRAWPLRPADLRGLRAAEVPRQMQRYGRQLGIRNPQDTPMVLVRILGPQGGYQLELVSRHKALLYHEMLSRTKWGDQAFEHPLLGEIPDDLYASLSAAQERKLEEGELTLRLPVQYVEGLIDATWQTRLFGGRGRRNPQEGKMTKAELVREIERDEFRNAYVEAMLWAELDDDGRALEENYTVESFTKEGLVQIIADCDAFSSKRGVERAIEDDLERAGHDFWLTRAGHGAGFWDGDWPAPAAKLLTEAAEAMGEVWVYVGDNGRLYLT